MNGYRELLRVVEQTAAEIFAAATTEAEVCELEHAIYEVIECVSAARIAELS